MFTHGSRGDVQPFAALARALKAAGHEVVLGAPASSTSVAQPYCERTISLFDGSDSRIPDADFQAAMESNFQGLRGKKVLVQAMRNTRLMAARVLDDMAMILDLVTASDTGVDVVVHHTNLPGNEIAERLGVPAIPVCLQPYWVPTDTFPDPLCPFPLPRTFNRASYLSTRLMVQTCVGSTSRWRTKTLDLPRRRGHRNVLRRPDGKPATVLQAFSQHVLPSPVSYPEWVHTTGFWYLPAEADYSPPRELRDFLNAGDPPVYIGFGSMLGRDPRRKGRIIAEAIRRAGVRAVVATGWGGIRSEGLGEDVLCVDQAPHDWLFPRMAAIVHHGGSGTIGAALASGRPQVVCPFFGDQHFFARRMHAIGAATLPQPQHRLTPDGLATAIRQAAYDRTLAAGAEELGKSIRADEGTASAVKVLESVAKRSWNSTANTPFAKVHPEQLGDVV